MLCLLKIIISKLFQQEDSILITFTDLTIIFHLSGGFI